VPAKVRIGCEWLYADENGNFRHEHIPAGRYWCDAIYNDVNQHMVMKSGG
jgi:hypothetical protein